MKSAQYMFLLVTTGLDLTHLGMAFPCTGTNARKLHFLSKYGLPIMVWFGNKVSTLLGPIWLPICLSAQGVEQGLEILGCQTSGCSKGRKPSMQIMWRLSVKLWITNSLHLLNVCVCSGNEAEVLLTSMMVDKKHCCQLSEGKKHKHPGN